MDALSRKVWVILVDDDEDDRFLIRQAFAQYNPASFLQALSSGYELFQLLEESVELPSLLLLDINMPLMNGFEVLKLLRANSAYDSIPVVFLTTSDATTDSRLAYELGASEFLTKPSNLEELIKVIKRLSQDWLMGE